MKIIKKLIWGTRHVSIAEPIRDVERQQLQSTLWQSRYFPEAIRDRLIKWSRVFIREKNWEGCQGVDVTPTMKFTIAATAGMMVLGYSDWYFDTSKSVVLYPTPYRAVSSGSILGTRLAGEFHRAGETIYRGPVVLNWNDVSRASQSVNWGNNLVVHEFAHQLDMINDPQADGVPPLPPNVSADRWKDAMQAEFHAARTMVFNGNRTLISDYGLTEESEFFAVASELYFQTPNQLRQFHPNVHMLLKQFYRFDLIDHGVEV